MHHLLFDIGVAVMAATILGLSAHWLRQPILLGYLLAGALIGPKIGFHFVHEDSIETISEIGLVLLLFIIGLELKPKELLAAGKQLLVTGFGQFPINALLGVGVFALLGYGLGGPNSDGLYLALLTGMSSTAIVVKLLYDKGELDTLPGRLTLGVLVVQDIYAIFILAFQPNFANPTLGPILKALGGTVGLMVGGFVVSRFVLRWVFTSIAKTPEMVLAVSIGWCAAVAGTAIWLGLSKEMGALVAGLSIAAFPYSIHVTAKTLPLRDFFMTLFFVSLGMKIAAPTMSLLWPVLLVVAFTVLSRFVSVYPLIAMTGGGRRAAFVSSINLAQISEFSLVIAALGVTYGHIKQDTVNIVLYAMAITAVLSSYGIRYSHGLYLALDALLRRLRGGAAACEPDQAKAHGADCQIAILGYHRGARALVDAMEKLSPELLKRTLVIDFNPVVLEEIRARGIACLFGDISSLDTLHHANLHEAKLVLSTIPDMLLKGTDNLGLVRLCKAVAPHATIVATADDATHEKRLRAEGALIVARPHELMGEWLARMVAQAMAA
jgi:Kef-type K+ transport system membrane component KefB